MIKILKSLLLIVCLTAPVFAQQAGTDIAVLKAGVGARPLGMGSAFTAVADNVDAPYWNPAGLGFIGQNEITTSQTKLSTDANHYYMSYIKPAWGGTLGISWIQVGLGSISQTSSEVDVNNEVVDLGVFSYFSNAYLFSYGRALNDRVSVGLTAKYLTSNMTDIIGGQAFGYSITPGLLWKFKEGWTLGAKLDEMINAQQWGTSTIEHAPPKLRVGLAYRPPQPGSFVIDISQVLRSSYAAEVSTGYEWSVDGLAMRLGYTGGGLTAGAGFAAMSEVVPGADPVLVKVDYAYCSQADLTRENVHRISLSGAW